MSKAEELAKEYAENVMLCVDHRSDVYDAFIDGYEQAEEDLELSWEDMERIIKCYQDIMAEKNRAFVRVEDYKEVLNRFNKERNGK